MAKKKKRQSRKERKEARARKQAAAPQAQEIAEAKVTKPVARREKAPRAVRKQPNAIERFIRETRGELKKVSWPTKQEAWRLTVVVTVVTVFMAAFLGFFDWLFTRLFALILG